MTETADAPPNERPLTFRCYAETPEQAALAVNGSQPPSAIRMAREQMTLIAKADGYSLVHASVREVAREAVVVDEQGEWRPVDGDETPTGHIYDYEAVATLTPDGDHDVIVLVDGAPEGHTLTFAVPANLVAHGGPVRVQHNLGGPVTVIARDADGGDATYMLATPLDDNTEHIDLSPGCSFLRVTLDEHVES